MGRKLPEIGFGAGEREKKPNDQKQRHLSSLLSFANTWPRIEFINYIVNISKYKLSLLHLKKETLRKRENKGAL